MGSPAVRWQHLSLTRCVDLAIEEQLDPSLGALLTHGPFPQLSYQLACRIALMLGALFGHRIEKSKFVYAVLG